MKSLEKVHEALKLNSDAATEPFWEHKCEIPLHYAVRSACSPEIVKLLLDSRASIESTDMRGRTAAQIANEPLPWEKEKPMFQEAWMMHCPYMHCPYIPDGLSACRDQRETWRREMSVLLMP
jgi:hypothetical protein